MRSSHLTSAALAAATLIVGGALAPSAQAQQQPRGAPTQQGQPRGAPTQQGQPRSTPPVQQQQQQQQPSNQDDQQSLAPPKAYKPVPVRLPQSVQDPGFVGFRKQLEALAQRKDRNALAGIVSQQFFWVPEDKDVAEKGKSGIDNLSDAIGLDGADAQGWDLLLDLAAEPTAEGYPSRPGTVCAPGEATFDDKAAEDLANATQTDAAEWGYPAADGVPVRSGPAADSAVIEKLGLYLVRAYPDDSPAAAVSADSLRIVTPSGKLGYINSDMLRPLLSDQLCYVKEGNVWKIVGAIGGGSQ